MVEDNIYLGVAAGIVAPMVAFWLYYISKFSHIGLKPFVQHLLQLNLGGPVLSLSMVANLAVFFFFIWLKADRSARGVLLATFIYGALILFFVYTR